MGILLDAARAWNDLCKVAYQVVLGKKGSAYTLELTRSGRESVLLRRHPGYPGQGT